MREMGVYHKTGGQQRQYLLKQKKLEQQMYREKCGNGGRNDRTAD